MLLIRSDPTFLLKKRWNVESPFSSIHSTATKCDIAYYIFLSRIIGQSYDLRWDVRICFHEPLCFCLPKCTAANCSECVKANASWRTVSSRLKKYAKSALWKINTWLCSPSLKFERRIKAYWKLLEYPERGERVVDWSCTIPKHYHINKLKNVYHW